jgi:hypothetical protein
MVFSLAESLSNKSSKSGKHHETGTCSASW